MESVLEKIKFELSNIKTEIYSNIVYQIKNNNEEDKLKLKSLLKQGNCEEYHTIVEIDFTSKNASTKIDNNKNDNNKTDNQIAYNPIISIKNSPIFICGKYIKMSREMCQTPLFIKNAAKTTKNVSDFSKNFQEFFGGSSVKFMGCGREDIDVRCLEGRPFILEISTPTRNITKINTNDINLEEISASTINNNNDNYDENININNTNINNNINKININLEKDNLKIPIKLYKEIKIINPCVVRKECKDFINKEDPIKFYNLLIYSNKKINFEKNYTLEQKTPLRVLHRRANMIRKKSIEILKVEEIEKEGYYYDIDIKASSGAYIKEWVTGDFGRTVPNLDSDLLELDVIRIDLEIPKEYIYRAIDLCIEEY